MSSSFFWLFYSDHIWRFSSLAPNPKPSPKKWALLYSPPLSHHTILLLPRLGEIHYASSSSCPSAAAGVKCPNGGGGGGRVGLVKKKEMDRASASDHNNSVRRETVVGKLIRLYARRKERKYDTHTCTFRHHHVFCPFFPQISVRNYCFWAGLAYIIFAPTAAEAQNCLSAYIFWGSLL